MKPSTDWNGVLRTDEQRMPWWGWGDESHERVLSPTVEARLVDLLGELGHPEPPVPLESFQAPSSRLGSDAIAALTAAVGVGQVSVELRDRVLNGAGKSYPDLVRMRSGQPLTLPDAVVAPLDADGVAAMLKVCVELNIAVVPFGGGTSVVGGVEAVADNHTGVVSLDLRELSGAESISKIDLTATIRGGTRAPTAEAQLNAQGLTLGHFPQSYEYATIGGFAATRSSGQASTGYGRFDANVLGLEMVAPTGTVRLSPSPGTAAGPDMRAACVGSEGTLGVITAVDLRVHELPEVVKDIAWVVRGFEAGAAVLRELEQNGCAPDVARLSDEAETEVSLSMAATSFAGRVLGSYVNRKGRGIACLLITGFEGDPESVATRIANATAILRRAGASRVGTAAGKAWRKGRFQGPYLRDVLMERGLLVDTLETSAPWSGLSKVHQEVSQSLHSSLAAHGGEPIVMCHVSHLYASGASLYFTFIGRQPETDTEARIAVWQKVKSDACDAIIRAGGTITHHHAIGVDHRDWMNAEIGNSGVGMLAALKRELDPTGIMNPGKLIPPTPG